MKVYEGVEVWLQSFLTYTLDRGELSSSCPGCCIPGRRALLSLVGIEPHFLGCMCFEKTSKQAAQKREGLKHSAHFLCVECHPHALFVMFQIRTEVETCSLLFKVFHYLQWNCPTVLFSSGTQTYFKQWAVITSCDCIRSKTHWKGNRPGHSFFMGKDEQIET